jgi:FdhD protein
LRERWHADRIEETETTWRDEGLEPDSTFRSRRCLEISGMKRDEIEVDVAVDENVSIVLNGGCVAVLAALPVQLKEMAIGFLIGEGLAEHLQDIVSVREEKGALICQTRNGRAAAWNGHQCCSVGGSTGIDLNPISSELKMKAGTILSAVDQLNSQARLWRRTGATHTSLICRWDGEVLISREDVSRSCSVDKAVGAALLAGIDPSQCALITSGRLSGAMVAKAARAGFPILVSRSAPMNSGVELAQNIGMTLIGFARSPNLYVYSGRERIIGSTLFYASRLQGENG